MRMIEPCKFPSFCGRGLELLYIPRGYHRATPTFDMLCDLQLIAHIR